MILSHAPDKAIPKFHALLGQFRKLGVVALITDNAGRVLDSNLLAKAMRRQQVLFCNDFCLNQVEPLPASGKLIVYKDSEQRARSATVVSTRINERGDHLILFIEPQLDPIQALGFIIYDASQQDCYWSQRASLMHGERIYQAKQPITQFLRWYAPAQRDRLLYAILQCEQSHCPQQVSLDIAYSRQRIRYLWLTLPIQGKPITCAFIRTLPTGNTTRSKSSAVASTMTSINKLLV